MIQRIQTIYLAIVVLSAIVLPFFLYLWLGANGEEFFAKHNVLIAVAFYSVAALGLTD